MNSFCRLKILQGALLLGLISPLPSEAGIVTFMKGLKDKIVSPFAKKNEPHALGSAAEQEAKKLSKESIEFIKKYGTDLTDLARRGLLRDDFVERANELAQIFRILNVGPQGTGVSKNPLIYGDPGVGKTMIVKKLAYIIAMKPELLPYSLQNIERVIQLNNHAFTSSAGGVNAQEKIKQLNQFLSDNDDVILFIDEIQNLAGSGPGETNYLAMMLPTLLGEAPGMKPGTQVRVIATTMTNSKDEILKIEGMSRRFAQVLFGEGDKTEILNILEPELPKIKADHGVDTPFGILELAYKVSKDHWPEVRNPQATKNILWQIASGIEVSRVGEPRALKKLKSTYEGKKIELKSARSQEADGPVFVLRERDLIQEISELEDKIHRTQSEWNHFDNNFGSMYKAMNDLVKVQAGFEQIMIKVNRNISPDVNQINKLATRLLKNLNQLNINLDHTGLDEFANYLSEIKKLELEDITLIKKLLEYMEKDVLLKMKKVQIGVQLPIKLVDTITEEDLFNYIAEVTNKNIDTIRLGTNSKQTLSTNLKQQLDDTVVGQDHVVEAIVRKYQEMENQMRTNKKPVSFLIVGGSRTGKTYIPERVGELLSKEGHFILNMGEYQSVIDIRNLTKTPPGYVGFGQPIPLAEYFKRNPVSVVTFDEIDMADASVIDFIDGLITKGYMEDHSGQKVDISGVTFFFTSNVTQDLDPSRLSNLKRIANPVDKRKLLENEIMLENSEKFHQRFLNRMNGGIFRMNEFSEKTKILLANRIFENSYRKSFRESANIDVHLDAEVFWYLGAQSGGDAAKVSQTIESRLWQRIGDLMTSGHIQRGDFVDVSLDLQKIETENPLIITVRKDLRDVSKEVVLKAADQRKERASLTPILETMPDEVFESFSSEETAELIKQSVENLNRQARLRNNLPAVQPENVKE